MIGLLRALTNTTFIIWIGLSIYILLDQIFSIITMNFFTPVDITSFSQNTLVASKEILLLTFYGELQYIEVRKIISIITLIICALLIGLSAENFSDAISHNIFFILILSLFFLAINPVDIMKGYYVILNVFMEVIITHIVDLFIDLIIMMFFSYIGLKISER